MLPTIATGNVASAIGGGYEVANSCRFNDGDSAYMHNTLSSSDGSDVKGTISFWTKRGTLGANMAVICGKKGNTERVTIGFSSDDYFEIQFQDNSNAYNWRSSAVYRDVAAWYNFVIHLDTGNATANSRARVWVNNSEITSWGTRETCPQNLKIGFFNGTDGNKRLVGARGGSSVDKYYDGYIAEVVVLNNTLDAATNFGEYDEDTPTVLKPKDVSGLTFGTNGFYLDFEDSSALGNDAAGSNNFTVNSIAATDSTTDTPTNNFCTMNPLDNYYAANTYSEGNTKFVTRSSGGFAYGTSTVGLTAGKWYAEFDCIASDDSPDYHQVGIVEKPSGSTTTSATANIGSTAYSWGYMSFNGTIRNNDGYTSYGDSWAPGDIIGVYLDLDNNKLYFSKNGTIQNSGTGISITAPASNGTGHYFITAGGMSTNAYVTFEANFGNPFQSQSSSNTDTNGYGSFEYDPSDGGSSSFDSAAKDFLAICTKNLGSDGG